MKMIDTHTHTSFSFDGENSPREMLEKALELGLHALTFTDHIDVNDYYGSEYEESRLMPLAAVKIPPICKEYADRIGAGFGAEIGQFMHDSVLANKLIAEFKLDYVIGSIHNVRNYKDFYYLNFNHTDPYKVLDLYFDEVLETAKNADIDVIGHLLYPLRYITGKYKIQIDINRYTEIIQDIFKTAAERGIGLELNTKDIRNPDFPRANPPLEYVRLFRELGGEILTIGSDAHRASALAENFASGAEIARTAGFKQITYFMKRKPIFIDL